MDDTAWAAAPWTTDFVDIEGDRRPRPRFRTRAKMLWDDRFFYVAAELEEPNLWATLRERDSIIFHDNDFEVFLDPDGDSHLYTEIELTALNTVWDLLLVKPYRDGGPAIHAWDIPGLKTAVHLEGTLNEPGDDDTIWTVEIAIPFGVLAETTRAACPPRVGDRWRLNFSRVQWQLDVRDGQYTKILDADTGNPLPENNWVWSPQRKIAMHEPEYWGIVEFVEKADGAVAADAVDRAAWTLRQVSYRLADAHDEGGRYPATIATEPGIEYWSDGTRYTLSTETGGAVVTLDETGRLTTARPE
ncbi:carbohydrate-binding family 9-like protein [bacterium CG17_big_fil_post_rev_8_21_14_2_50_64_8]|nr:MAG: carbohydrate-binding family 9-like protein [bacterium CG17_big_fil_post_rev_8_21_14_2_50_64_8]